VTSLGFKIFFMFATIDIGFIAVFAYMLPETAGKSLEEMDVMFGAVSAEDRKKDIAKAERALGHVDNDSASEEKQQA